MLPTRGKLFGTNGARGIANADLTPELAMGIGRAFGAWLTRRGDTMAPQVAICRDTRPSGAMLAAATSAGLCSKGVIVRDCGILTTPGLCLLARNAAKAGGVIISASHNPPLFNGIKLVDSHGTKLADATEQAIETLVFAEEDLSPVPTGVQVGTIQPEPAPGERYLDLLFALSTNSFALEGLRVVLDCGFGAAYALAPEAFRRAGARYTTINDAPDGARINVGCGATDPSGLAEEVVAREADIGVAFDGDADRAIFVDHTGAVRNGDHIKYALARDLHERGLLEPASVVGTVMSNLGLELALRERGIALERANVGDRYVTERMRETGALLGGEQSGHIIFAEHGVGDGIYTALRVCDLLTRTGQTLAELCAPVQEVPQTLINVPVRDKHLWEQSARLEQQVVEWQRRLEGRGRVLIRSSGTEPVVRVMVEALDQVLATRAAESLADLIAREFGYGELLSEEE